jgi:hypothetical protein
VAGPREDMVWVPRKPTADMLKAEWFEANEENAVGVWRDMIEAWKSSSQQREVDER